MITWEDLWERVSAEEGEEGFVTTCFNEASELVLHFVGLSTVPQVIVDRATLNVGAELFNQRSRFGIGGFDNNGMPVRISKDPMTAAYPLLRQYMVIL